MIPSRAIALLVLLPALAGCFGSNPPPPPPPTDPAAVFEHLTADGAQIRDGDGTRTFTWQEVANPSVSTPAGDTLGTTTFEFEVDASVGFARAHVSHGSVTPLLVLVHDERGRKACTSVVPSPGNDCTAAVHADASGVVRFVATVSHAPADLFPQGRPDPVPYTLDVTLHGPADRPTPAPAPSLDPRFSFDVIETGSIGFEPTVGVDRDGTIYLQQSTQTLRSENEGATWQDITPPSHAALNFSLDPLLFLDQWTSRLFVDHLYAGCSHLAWSDDGGATWITNPAACGLPLNDHQKLAAGDNPMPTLYDGIVYYSFMSPADLATARQDGGIWVTRSLDGGVTWIPGTPAYHGTQGFNYAENGPVTADRDGTVYLPVYLVDRITPDGSFVDGGFAVSVSQDHGVSFVPQRLGDAHRPEDLDAGTGIDAAGNAFIAFLDADGVHVFRSTDRGSTWQGPFDASDASLRSFVLGDAVAGDDGHVAVAYIASPDTDRGPHQADGWARWHLYVSVTENGLDPDPTWVTTQVTEHPVNVGTICMFYVVCPGGGDRNLGDFLDVQLTPDGRVVVAFVDACPEGCTTHQESSGTAGMVAIQQEGPRLFRAGAPWAT